MYVLMKIEIKNNYDGSLEYMQDEVIGTYEKVDDAIEVMNANADKHTDDEITDLMINLMNTLVRYKNSYRPITYAYRVMNSLLDIVKNTFVELNK